MQVQTGTEETICRQCEKIVDSGILERSFVLYYEEKKKYQGEWHTRKGVLFPGYVFVITEQIHLLCEKLRDVIGMTKLIGTGKEIVALTEEEVRLLRRLGNGNQLVKMSSGFIVNDRVKILEGPLKGMEGAIRRIDRHKRKAYLALEMFGRKLEMQVGLEIVDKITE